MSYVDEKLTGRGPGAIALVAAIHVLIGWMVLNIAVASGTIETDGIIEIITVKSKTTPPPEPVIIPTETPIIPEVYAPQIKIKTPPVSTPPIIVTTKVPQEFPQTIDRHLPPLRTDSPVLTSDPVIVGATLDRRFQNRFQPPYPPSSQRREEEGVVGVAVTIGTDGRVTAANIARSSGFERLDTAAIRQALRHWRFVPATRDGTPIESERTISVRFELRQG
ncbi:MAG: energy transducer TonB [Pseudomonadota bacterium]